MNTNQRQFRESVCKRDRRCLITRFDQRECDACHIIPSRLCSKYNLPFAYSQRNGILLTKSLHTLFDQFIWTFDIYDITFDENKKKYKSKIIISPGHRNLSIHNYKNLYGYFPIECFTFMYVHYQMFILHNFKKVRKNPQTIENSYCSILRYDPIFKYLYENEIPVQYLINKDFKNFLLNQGVTQLSQINAIVKHKNYQEKYFVWWNHLPYSDCSWEEQSNLKSPCARKSIESYHNHLEQLNDEDFT